MVESFAVAGEFGFEEALGELLNGRIFFNMPRMRLPPPTAFSALSAAWLGAGEDSELESFDPCCCCDSVSSFEEGDKRLSNDRNVLGGMT